MKRLVNLGIGWVVLKANALIKENSLLFQGGCLVNSVSSGVKNSHDCEVLHENKIKWSRLRSK